MPISRPSEQLRQVADSTRKFGVVPEHAYVIEEFADRYDAAIAALQSIADDTEDGSRHRISWKTAAEVLAKAGVSTDSTIAKSAIVPDCAPNATVKDSLTVTKVCSLCGCEAEYIATEGVWRHTGDPFEDKYLAQLFCHSYGYPIPVIDMEEWLAKAGVKP